MIPLVETRRAHPRAQHALITRRQAVGLGRLRGTASTICSRTGIWEAVDRGLYGPAGVPHDLASPADGGGADRPGGSLVSHRAGAALLGVGGLHEPTSRSRSLEAQTFRRPWLITHESLDLHLADGVTHRWNPDHRSVSTGHGSRRRGLPEPASTTPSASCATARRGERRSSCGPTCATSARVARAAALSATGSTATTSPWRAPESGAELRRARRHHRRRGFRPRSRQHWVAGRRPPVPARSRLPRSAHRHRGRRQPTRRRRHRGLRRRDAPPDSKRAGWTVLRVRLADLATDLPALLRRAAATRATP